MISIFKLLTSMISIYSFLCFIRIMLTWFPGLAYSRFAQILSSLCDPYLNLFRRLPLRFGAFDFSPLISFGVLMVASSIFGNLAMSRSITFGLFLVLALNMLLQIINSLITFFIFFLVIRLIILLIRRDSYSSIWSQIDYSINPLVFKISSLFSGGRPISYKNSLIISIFTLLAFNLGVRYIANILFSLLARLPF
ncbi:YggT family protein [Treponema parvum]|uniref:YggT family protein n=1 Tax=Treponema parvum TaxID=138851 RepID=A0A975IBP6_9SPIR|nr:YggT family protein [Treponema parvum]QTQ11100.1 YggT family protein [Treponema parvum]QTQ16960.1 YggT family protein [Treponema parvum]